MSKSSKPSRPLREYEPIWKELTVRKKVKVSCSKQSRRTIKRGVIKEKDMDEKRKYAKRERLRITEVEDGLIFELRDFTPLSWILK